MRNRIVSREDWLKARTRDPRPGPDHSVADWLCLAAAPTFAAMALITLVFESGPMATLCSAAPGASVLTGMAPMYLLMSAFHAVPWLKLIASLRRRRDQQGHRIPPPLSLPRFDARP